MQKRTSLQYSFVVMTVLYFILLPFIIGISVLNYYIYIPVSFFFIYSSIHYFCFYCVFENDKINKKYPARLFSSTIEIKLKELKYEGIICQYGGIIYVVFNGHNKKNSIDISVSKNDLLILCPYLVEKNILIDVNVRKDAVDLRRLIRKLTKNYYNIKW